MDQVLFVLHEGAISQWWLNRGKLSLATLKGLSRLEFSDASAPQFWDWWVEDNNAEGDSFDAIFLSSSKAGFGDLPKCFLPDSRNESAWTLEKLSLLANEPMFSGQSLAFVCGKNSRLATGASEGETPLKLVIQSSLKFTLPKDEPKKEAAKPEPAKPVVKPTPSGIIGDSYNDSEALKLAVGDELKGTIVKIFNAMKRNYVKVDGLKEQVCFKSIDTTKFAVGDEVSLTVTKVDDEAKKVLFAVVKE